MTGSVLELVQNWTYNWSSNVVSGKEEKLGMQKTSMFY